MEKNSLGFETVRFSANTAVSGCPPCSTLVRRTRSAPLVSGLGKPLEFFFAGLVSGMAGRLVPVLSKPIKPNKGTSPALLGDEPKPTFRVGFPGPFLFSR